MSRSRDAAIADLMRVWRASRRQTELRDDVAFHKLGINRTDGRCLDALSEGPMTATALAQASGVTANALTTVVDRLAERGLVERVRDSTDRRRVVIRLTPLADYLSTQLYGPVVEWLMKYLEKCTMSELELIEDFFTQGRDFQVEHIEYIRNLQLSWTLPGQSAPAEQDSTDMEAS